MQKLYLLKAFMFLNALFLLIHSGYSKTDETIKLIGQKGNSILIDVNIDKYKIEKLNTNLGELDHLFINNGSYNNELGYPNLPSISTSAIIPDIGNMEIKIVEEEFEIIDDIKVSPSKGRINRNQDPKKIPFVYGDVYKQNDFFPANIVSLSDPYILRDYRGQTIKICPFQYNPITKQLKVVKRIRIELVKSKQVGSINEYLRKDRINSIDEEFSSVYKQHFINYSNKSRYTPINESGKMLIVSHSKYSSEMKDLIEWKTQRGLQVEMVNYEDVASSSDELKSYVYNYYKNSGLTYLLLVGDGEDIPSLYKSGDSDAAYGHLEGADSYAEVFVGRFSAESIKDVKTQVQRTIHYERDVLSNEDWMEVAMGIASDEGGNGSGDDGEADSVHMENIRTDLLKFGYSPVHDLYDPGVTPSDVSVELNQGMGLINYVGHGSDYSWVSSGFSRSDINALKNDNKLPFIFDVACVNGNFHGQTCFAETWMRATNNDKPTGAVAIIASTINQSWEPPMDAQDEMVDLLVESYANNIKRTFGGITINGCMHMNDEYGSQGAEMTDTWTIFGDPSLLVRTKSPENITIEHQNELVYGIDSVLVKGDNGLIVTLSVGDKLLASKEIVDDSVSIYFDPINSFDSIIITAVGYNKVSYQSKLGITGDTIQFTVNDGTNPLENALIEIDGFEKKTNSSGVAEFVVGPGMDKPFIIRKTGFDNYLDTVDVVSKTSVDITMAHGVATYKVSFDIKGEENEALNGVKVNFKGGDRYTNQDGIIVFDSIQAGDNIPYIISKTLYDTIQGILSVSEENINILDTMKLSRYDVTFKITDENGPLKGVKVNFNENSLKTDADGICIFKNNLPGLNIDYSSEIEGYEIKTGQIDIEDKDQNLNLKLDVATFDLEFRVFSDQGDELQNCVISIFNNESNLTNGLIKYESIPYQKDVSYTIEADDHFVYTDKVNITRNRDVNITLEKLRYNITFNVVDKEGNPIQNAKIEFNTEESKTPSTGDVTFKNVIIGNSIPYTVEKGAYKTVNGAIDVVNTDLTENVVLSLLTGIDDEIIKENRIYPNPFYGSLNFELISTNNKIEIYNAIGKLVHKETIEGKEQRINLYSLPKGVYLIKIINEDKINCYKILKD